MFHVVLGFSTLELFEVSLELSLKCFFTFCVYGLAQVLKRRTVFLVLLSKLGAIGGSGVVFVSAWAFGSPFFVSAWAFGCPFFVRAVLIIGVIGLVFLVITTETSGVAKDVEECSLFFVQSFS